MNDLKTINPFTQREIQKYNWNSYEETLIKVQELKLIQKKWKAEPIKERLLLVKKGLEYFETHKEQIAHDISSQMGRPLKLARYELNGFFERANYLCQTAEETLKPDEYTDKEGFEREIHHEPFGVIFVISAWNYPLLITVNSIIPALISGNTVLLKHSSLTPEIGVHFERAFKKLGSFEPLLKNVVLSHEVTGEVIENTPIDHVVFTGSVKGGHEILKHTQVKFMQPTLELGGKDAVFVDKDVDLNHAVESVVDGAMFNSGQSCCGIERAYVHDEIYEEFVEKAKSLIDSYILGDPEDEKTTIGPLAQAHAANFMKSQVDEAVSKGAKILAGGSIEKIKGATFFQPTLIVNADHSMSIMKEENFGPILPIMKVGGLQQAIDFVNDSDYGLTSAIFTVNKANADHFFNEVNTGTVFMNRCDYLDPALSWTGIKNSGCGSSLSKYGFYNVTRRKSKHFKLKV